MYYKEITLPSPNITQRADYQVFKKTKEEKSDVVAAKWRHKKYMEDRGVNPNKFLNIPEHRLVTPIIITT